MKLSILILSCALMFAGCNGNQQAKTLNTISSVEIATDAAYKSYVSLVIDGKLTTNDVPAASSAFNKFQASSLLATVAVKNNTNALAPDSLIEEAAAAVALFNQFKGGK